MGDAEGEVDEGREEIQERVIDRGTDRVRE